MIKLRINKDPEKIEGVTKKKVEIRIRDDPFVWDGTFIGSFSSEVVVNDTYFKDLRYTLLNLWGFKAYCILIPETVSTPADLLCIYDELKEIFGLVKTGTHSLKIKNKKYVIYRAIFDGKIQFDEPVSDEIMNKYKHLENLKVKIKQILTYRHVLGVSPNSESGIKIRRSGTGLIFPISLNDRFTINQKEGVIKNGVRKVSEKNVKKWFLEDDTFPIIIQQMLHFKTTDDVPEVVGKIRDRISEVIHRINKDLIWLENIICTTLVDYLEDSFDDI